MHCNVAATLSEYFIMCQSIMINQAASFCFFVFGNTKWNIFHIFQFKLIILEACYSVFPTIHSNYHSKGTIKNKHVQDNDSFCLLGFSLAYFCIGPLVNLLKHRRHVADPLIPRLSPEKEIILQWETHFPFRNVPHSQPPLCHWCGHQGQSLCSKW